jgi:hypothetical protein
MVVTTSPANSIIFLFDRSSENVVVPDYSATSVLNRTTTCVSVGTLSEFDGETKIELHRFSESKRQSELTWFDDVEIATPGGSVSVVTADNKTLLTESSNNGVTLISIGVNDLGEPDKIIFLIKK